MLFLNKNLLSKGFTLVEILLVISLLILLTIGISGFDYSKNKIRTAMIDDTQSISFSVRDVQNKSANSFKEESFDSAGYGAFFNLEDSNRVDFFYKNKNLTFSDLELSATGNQSPEEDLFLTEGNTISRICLNDCSHTTSKLAIYFLSPKPYAFFAALADNGSYLNTVSQNDNTIINKACIEISPRKDVEKRHVDIYHIGQISFASGPCQ